MMIDISRFIALALNSSQYRAFFLKFLAEWLVYQVLFYGFSTYLSAISLNAFGC